MKTTNILQLKQVCKTYNGFSLDHLNLSLKRGFIMGFIGPNGAGKSTTIRCIMGLTHIDSGTIQLFGMDHRKHAQKVKEKIGFVYDQDVFFEEITVEKNKKIISSFYRTWNDELFYRYAERFGIPLDKPMKSLSKGTRVKFALAVALSHEAELIIMDEPTAGLDPIFRRELLDILLDIIQDERKSVFFSTHITTDLEQIADYVTFILDGKIVLSEETETLLNRYVLVRGPNHMKKQMEPFHPLMLKETLFGIEGLIERKNIDRLAETTELNIERPTLEDIMYYFVKSK